MRIKYIAWKQVISSDVNRLIYNTKGPGLHNKGDQAIQNFNTLDNNPGLWSGFTNGIPIPRQPGLDIKLKNSVNPLNLWYSINVARHNPVKINHEIWDREGDHGKRIIEPWYLGYMRILKQVLERIVKRDGNDNANVNTLLSFVSNRLEKTIDIRTNILKWVHETQDGFSNLDLDTSFMKNENIRNLVGFVEDYYYLVVKCEDNDETYNMALMANSKAKGLHSEIRKHLLSNKVGGKIVDINVSAVASSPDAQRFLEALYKRRNIILYGPPGTGKTHLLTELDHSFNAEVLFDDLDTEAPFRITGDNGLSAKEWCTFHPNYSYESFVYGLEPIVLQENKLGFKTHIGPMLKLAKKAEAGIKSLLIIDEINRANTDAVFGNASAIIDPQMNDVVTLSQPIIDEEGNSISDFKSSENLFVVGTMNSLDKSTSPLSAELKRRFCIVELSPNVEVLNSYLEKNNTVNQELSKYTCRIMSVLNEKIREYCGKEYELGQGYFWGLVDAQDNHENVLAEILKNKVIPHLRDVLPNDCIGEFFGANNINILYSSSDFGFEIVDGNSLSNLEVLQAFARVVESDLEFNIDEENDYDLSLDDYENLKANHILEQLKIYKNVIISGCSGTGKSYYVSKIMNNNYFDAYAKTHWHTSTEYSDVIEGISATVNGTDICYSIQPGAVKSLAEKEVRGSRLMVIENINKSSAAENFGELITLLEPDKRNLKIVGYDGYITIPEDMMFLCTMTPGLGEKKLDSALKRRFSIIEFAPDYKALSLRLNVNEEDLAIENYFEANSRDIKITAIKLLRSINQKLKNYVGLNAQIGQSAFWNLPEDCDCKQFLSAIDDNVLPYLEDYCTDEDIAHKLFGADSPMLRQHHFGLELKHFNNLSQDEVNLALKGIIQNA